MIVHADATETRSQKNELKIPINDLLHPNKLRAHLIREPLMLLGHVSHVMSTLPLHL